MNSDNNKQGRLYARAVFRKRRRISQQAMNNQNIENVLHEEPDKHAVIKQLKKARISQILLFCVNCTKIAQYGRCNMYLIMVKYKRPKQVFHKFFLKVLAFGE